MVSAIPEEREGNDGSHDELESQIESFTRSSRPRKSIKKHENDRDPTEKDEKARETLPSNGLD